MKQLLAVAAALALPACTLVGEIELAGSFAGGQAPSEIRYTLHPGYGFSAMDMAFMGKEKLQAAPYKSLFPDASGAFTTGREKVAYDPPPMKPPPPAYWLSFANEKDAIYGMGQTKTGFDYRMMDVAGKTNLDRAIGCWLIKSGEFIYPPEDKGHAVILRITLDRNPATTKSCTEAPKR